MIYLAENASQIFRFCSDGDHLVHELQRNLGQELFMAGIRAILNGGLAQAEILLRKSLQFAGWRVVDVEVAKSLCRHVWHMARNRG
jgi:hypothetical protein